MTVGFALSIKRLYGPGIVRAASKHILRELVAELVADSHIDATRIADNFILRGPATSAEVAGLAKSLMEAAGVTKCRKGAVMGLELLFTLPPSADVEPRLYFEQATAWAGRHFGVPVLSCVVHADEGAWHAHALLLPLIDGHMVGSDLHGGKAKLAAMQASFHESVGAPHGLPKFTPQKRLSAPVRTAAIELARAALQANSALTDAVIEALLTPHAKDPAPLLLALGISMPSAQRVAKGSFIDLMTKPVPREPQSRIGKRDHNHIGKAIPAAPAPAFPESCVGKGIAPSPIPSHEQPLAPATDSTADHHAYRTNIVRLVEQREPATGDAQQQDGQGAQNILDTPPADQRQHSAENSAQCPHSDSTQTGTGNFSDTPAAPAGHIDQPDENRRLGAGAGSQGASDEFRTKADHVPAQPGIVENTESGFSSEPTTTATGGSDRRRPAQPPAGNGARHQRAGLLPLKGELWQADDFHRQRDSDHLAASDWGSPWVCRLDHPATGPPPATCAADRRRFSSVVRFR